MAVGSKELLRLRSLYSDDICERYDDRLVMNKIGLNRLRWAGYLIRVGEDDPARKVKRAISIVKKEDVVDLA